MQSVMDRDIDHILVSEEQLKTRVAELGTQISKDYAGKNLLLVSILKGSVVFMADLMRAVSIPCGIDFMVVSSYGGANTSSSKPSRRKADIEPDYCGFEVPDEFVVGYGLDYDEKYRNLSYVGVLKPEVYSK